MGLNVGGIHVCVRAGLETEAVLEAIRTYWLGLGAVECDDDPLELRPLSLERTGKLGFLVVPVDDWIAIYDSERYDADPALARHLATTLDTQAWYWQVAGATSRAYAKRYGHEEIVLRGAAVEAEIDELPAAFFYYNKVRETLPASILADLPTLCFREIPHRPEARYSGPSPDQRQSQALVERAREFAEARDAQELLEIADEPSVFSAVVGPCVEKLDTRDPANLAFCLALAPCVLDRHDHSRPLAVAALRAGDEALFTRAIGELTSKRASNRASLLEVAALELGEEPRIAFRLLEAATRSGASSMTAWNNAAAFLVRVADAPGLPDEQLEDFLAGCLAHAPANPSVFYNLACAFIALNRQEDALAAVRAAVQYGAPDLDALREEPLLAPIAGDARFAEAFTAERITTIDHFVVERGGHKLLQPSVGLHLFFDSDVEAAEPVAALIKQLSQELPEMFRSFRPSGVMAMRPITRGKVARDCTALRKRKSAYGVTCQYDSASGEACDLRLFLDLDAEGGELSIHLPLSWSDDPQALFVRLLDYVRPLPFYWGNAGWTLTPYEVGNLVGPATDAHTELQRILAHHPALTCSPIQSGWFFDVGWADRGMAGDFVVPSWLTFVGTDLLTRAPEGWADDLDVTELPHGVAIRLPEPLPGDTRPVVQALAPLMPRRDVGWEGFEKARLPDV